MPKMIVSFVTAVLFLTAVGTNTVLADLNAPKETGLPDVPQMRGRLEGTGAHFELNNSEYMNITLDSSESLKLFLESIPEMVTMQFESATGTSSTVIILSGFLPLTTYHKYEDDYHNHAEFTTDESGSYTYTQDLSKSHFVFIQPRPSTKFIHDNATGGDCILIGTWNAATKTCTLVTDLSETIQIDSNGITLDGNGHTITGSNTGYGVYLYGRTGVTTKNLNVRKFTYGIYLHFSNGSTIANNNASSNSYYGIVIVRSNDNLFIGNNASFNNGGIGVSGYGGYYPVYSYNNTITGNILLNNSAGISLSLAFSNNLTGNFISNSQAHGIVMGATSLNILTNNIISSSGSTGIYLDNWASSNIISSNTIGLSKWGILLYDTSYNNITGNTFLNNSNGVRLGGRCFGGGCTPYYNKVYNNNFINSPAYVYRGVGNVFNLAVPTGGNYWSNFDEPAEGCNNLNGDSFCDAPYIFAGGNDNLPWTRQSGWADSTPPITADNSPSTWQNADFIVSILCTDNPGGSGCRETKYRIDSGAWLTGNSISISTEGDHLIEYYSIDNAGNQEGIKSTHARLDKTPPSISGAATIPPNTNGWNDVDVTVHFDCSDGLSGLESCTPDSLVSSEGASQSVIGTATDKAGNSAITAVSGINIDKTEPTVIITSPEAKDYLHSDSMTLNFSAEDALSGIATISAALDNTPVPNGQVIDLMTLTPGMHTLTVNAVDNAGNSASKAVSFNVIVTTESLSAMVGMFVEDKGIANSPIAKLRAAQNAIDRGNNNAAINILSAFINELEALSGKKISQESANMLIADAEHLIVSL